MNQLVTLQDGIPVTTSIAISEGAGIEHRAVLQLIQTHLSKLVGFGEVAFEMRLNPQGSPTRVALLNERQATLVLTFMRNTATVADFKFRLVDAFFAMVDRAANIHPLVPQTLQDALRAYADTLDQNQGLKATIKAMEPAVEGLKRLADSEGTYLLTDAAKALKMGPKAFIERLRVNGWIYRRATGEWVGFQSHVDAGHLTHVTVEFDKPDGKVGTSVQVRITTKGLALIAKRLQVAS